MEDGPTADGGGGVRIARPGLESRQEAVRTHTGLEMVEALRKGRSSDRPGRQGRGGAAGAQVRSTGAREKAGGPPDSGLSNGKDVVGGG